MAVHIVLEEIGAPFELELVLSSGEREGARPAVRRVLEREGIVIA